MRILTVDTSTVVASAAVTEDDKLTAEIIINHQRKHSQKLLPAIDHLLQDAGLTIADMDAFGAVKGPGSFTGLRIGIATVKGFAQALSKPVVGISTLEALAANLLYADGIICPLLDARRGQVFTGIYRPGPEGLETLMADTLLDISSLTEQLNHFRDHGPVYLLGEGLSLYGKQIRESVADVRFTAPYLAQNRASSAGWLAIQKLKQGQGDDYFHLEPFYIRPSYAEEG